MKRDKITIKPVENLQYHEEFHEVKSKLNFVNNIHTILLGSYDEMTDIGCLVWPLKQKDSEKETYTPMILLGEGFDKFELDMRKAALAHEVGHLELFLNDGLEAYLKHEPLIKVSNDIVRNGIPWKYFFSRKTRKKYAELTLLKAMEEEKADRFAVVAGYGEPLLDFLKGHIKQHSFTTPYKIVMKERIKSLEGRLK